MKKFICLAWILFHGALFAQQDCVPAPPDSTRLVGNGQIHTVLGLLAPFDPCHRSVKLDMPGRFTRPLGDKPPVVIVIHGGGGLGGYERDTAALWNRNGFASLVFDAFEMNGFQPGSPLLLYQMTNGARQRMIYRATLGAYRWVLASDKVDTSRVFFQGLSNGGSVAINMAGAADSQHVRAVIAEGGPAAGIGFPDTLKVPLLLLYGAADNYGGVRPDDWMHTRGEVCVQNDHYLAAPPGFAARCNRMSAPEGNMPSPQAWYDAMREKGADIRFELVEGGGHGMMFADFSASEVPQASGRKFYRAQGASADTRRKVQAMVLEYFKSRL